MAVPPQGAGGITALSGLAIDTSKDWSGYIIKNLGQPVAVKDVLRQPGDDEKIYFGTDSDYSLYYDSTNDEYVIYDEVNATKLMRLPKNRTLNNVLESGGVHELLHSNMNIGTDDHHAQDHEARHESGGADALPLANLPQPGDDSKITLGAGPDYSIRYDSTDDCYYVRDEVNGVDIMKLVKNAAGAPIDLASHAARHKGGGDDPIRNVTSQSADYTASDGDIVLADASGGAITITLPSPSAGAKVEVKKTDSSANAVTVDGGGNNIDSSGSFDITTQYESYTMVSDGSNWYIV